MLRALLITSIVLAVPCAVHAQATRADLDVIDARVERLLDYDLDPGEQDTLEAYVQQLARRIEVASRSTLDVVRAYEPVIAAGDPAATIQALERQAAAFERLAARIRAVRFVLPRALQRTPHPLVRGAAPTVELRVQVDDRIRQTLEQRGRPIECMAIPLRLRALRLARASQLPPVDLERLAAPLRAHDDARLAECVAGAPDLAPYAPGEIPPARLGRVLEMPPAGSPPPLDHE